MGTCNARQTDQVGERHGRFLSRHRRCWRKRTGRDGASYRLYVKAPTSVIPSGECMPSSEYHREQAKILAGLALSTTDPIQADLYKLIAMQHLERAHALDDAESGPSFIPETSADKYADRA
jgi:hypothetical protein